MAVKVKVSSKYQVVIPKDIRERFGVEEGEEMIVDIEDKKIVMKKAPTRLVDMMKGLHREVWKDIIAEKYIDKERESWG